jgi:hypothetical protein
MPDIKPTTYRVYLNQENADLMRAACAKLEIGQSELLSKLVSAALRSIASNDYRMSLPLRFVVSGEPEPSPHHRLNEPPKPKRK